MFSCIFEGIQFLAYLADWYKNLENGNTLCSFFQIFDKNVQSEFCCKKVSKKKVHTGTV